MIVPLVIILYARGGKLKSTWGAMLLSEPLTWSMIATLVLILSGVILVNRAAAKKEQAEQLGHQTSSQDEEHTP